MRVPSPDLCGGWIGKPMGGDDLRVVYVGGSGRSGSTVLDMMVGGHSRALSLGQLDQLRQWVATDNVCTCGQPLYTCPLWSAVLGPEPPEPDRVPPALNVDGQVNKVLRTLPFLLGRTGVGTSDPEAAQTWHLLERVAAVSGASVLVDSSKTVLRFARLTAEPERARRLLLVHIVRDPRGYVASRVFPKPAPSARGFVGLTEAQPRHKAIADWLVQNTLTYLVGRLRHPDRYLVVTYETLVAQPVDTLSRIMGRLGLGFERGMLPPKSREDYHLIGGNSSRLAFAELRLDTSWKEKLSPRDQRLVWWLCGWLYRFLRRTEARERSRGV